MGYTKPDSISIRTKKTSGNPTGVITRSLDEVQNTPMGVFQQYMDNIIGARMQVYYDMFVLLKDTALANAAICQTFRSGLSEQGVVWNTGTNYTKTKAHTNMIEDGQFEYGVSVIVVAIEVLYIAPPATATTMSGGLISDAADAAVQPTRYNPSNFSRALLTQAGYAFKRGSDITEENGLLIDLPSNSGIAASFSAQDTCAVVQNSLGPNSARVLEFPKVLHSGENFQIDLTNLGPALSIPVDTVGYVRMIGKRLKSGRV